MDVTIYDLASWTMARLLLKPCIIKYKFYPLTSCLKKPNKYTGILINSVKVNNSGKYYTYLIIWPNEICQNN